MKRRHRVTVSVELPSAFAGIRFPPEVIVWGALILWMGNGAMVESSAIVNRSRSPRNVR